MMLLKRIGVAAALIWLGCVGQRESSAQKFLFLIGNCSQASAALNAVTLDAAHRSALSTYICSQVNSGVFAQLDVWYALQTANQAAALTNLVNPGTYNGTLGGAPPFVVDSGYTGTAGSTTIFIDTNFNPFAAVSPHFVRDSASMNLWVTAGNTEAHAAMGLYTATFQTNIYPRHTSLSAFYRINDGASASAGVAVASPIGLTTAVRSGSSAQNGYKNAVDQGVTPVASGALPSGTIHILGTHGVSGSGNDGSSDTEAIIAAGGALTASQVASFCHASNIYLNAISGLALGTC